MQAKEKARYFMLRLIFVCYLTPLRSEKFFLRPNLKLKQAYIFRQLDAIDKVLCVVRCSLDTRCRSVSWAPDLQQCLLSNRDVALREWHYKQVLAPMSGWLTFGVDVFHVAPMQGPRGGYTLTLSMAHQLCRAYGMPLASKTQLLAARAKGFNYCNCGWLSDGINGFVIQEQFKSCTRMWFHTGVMNCRRSTANAYCFID